jgi:hypothetical protein
MLAIILLNNSNLQDETLTAAKLELIRVAESRKASQGPSPGGISAPEFKFIEEDLTALHKIIITQHKKLMAASSPSSPRT